MVQCKFWEYLSNLQLRRSKDFLINIPKALFTDNTIIETAFRKDASISLGNIQNIRLSERDREECQCFYVFIILDFEAARLFVLRASSGILAQKHDQKYELSSFYVCFCSAYNCRNYHSWFMLPLLMKKCLCVAMPFFYFFNGSLS